MEHGGQVELAASARGCTPADLIDLSTGVHPAGPPAWLDAWLATHVDLVGRYPRLDGEPARSALANALAVSPDELLVCAGAQAAIEVVFQAMRWKTVAIRTPCYAEPLRCAKRAGVRAVPHGTRADAIWVTDPHNPTGARDPFPRGARGVLDEAYLAFDERRRLGVIPDCVRIGSLTKLFAVPGLPVAYVIAERALLERIRDWLSPWPASTLALHLVPELLAEALVRDALVRASRGELARLLERFGFHVRKSEASFVLARRRPGVAFEASGILVRRFPEWPSLSGWVRLGIPGPDRDWDRLAGALRDADARGYAPCP